MECCFRLYELLPFAFAHPPDPSPSSVGFCKFYGFGFLLFLFAVFPRTLFLAWAYLFSYIFLRA